MGKGIRYTDEFKQEAVNQVMVVPECKRIEFLLGIRAHHRLPFVAPRGDFIETSDAEADVLHSHVGFLFTSVHLSQMFLASYMQLWWRSTLAVFSNLEMSLKRAVFFTSGFALRRRGFGFC